jgi:hypothetical protein
MGLPLTWTPLLGIPSRDHHVTSSPAVGFSVARMLRASGLNSGPCLWVITQIFTLNIFNRLLSTLFRFNIRFYFRKCFLVIYNYSKFNG